MIYALQNYIGSLYSNSLGLSISKKIKCRVLVASSYISENTVSAILWVTVMDGLKLCHKRRGMKILRKVEGCTKFDRKLRNEKLILFGYENLSLTLKGRIKTECV
jgi:hypothetical protein